MLIEEVCKATMRKITSKENTVVKEVVRLNKSAKERKEKKLFIAEGIRLCRDAVASGAQFEFLCFSQSFLEKHSDIYGEFPKNCEHFLLSDSLFSHICDTKSPQGVLGAVKMLDKTADFGTIKLSGRILALENLQDPVNIGTILRTAEALGIDCVLLTQDCCDVYSPKAVRGSMGAVFRQKIAFTSDLPLFIERFKNPKATFAAVLSESAVAPDKVAFPKDCIVVVGNEGNGITAETVRSCFNNIIIPMSGKAESLNAAVAASILMWEMVK